MSGRASSDLAAYMERVDSILGRVGQMMLKMAEKDMAFTSLGMSQEQLDALVRDIDLALVDCEQLEKFLKKHGL